MLLLSLHGIARPGDGLAPELRDLLSVEQARVADPKLSVLRKLNTALPDIAGPPPGAGRPAARAVKAPRIVARRPG